MDGGNAVWMNIGDAAGSTGVRTYPFEGPAVGLDFRTLRLDLQFGEVTFSASRSKAETTAGREVEVDALGAIWRREFENTVLFVAAGYDEGQDDRFRSFSFGLTSGGFNVVLNRINRVPLVINSGITGAYDTTFKGLSLSYDFRDLTFGFAHSSQTPGPLGDRVFEARPKQYSPHGRRAKMSRWTSSIRRATTGSAAGLTRERPASRSRWSSDQ